MCCWFSLPGQDAPFAVPRPPHPSVSAGVRRPGNEARPDVLMV